ncbi:MAG: membrane protein insertase YidC [Treponema sp.]|nr:membrane protein insertase YidC [Treponema sp.]
MEKNTLWAIILSTAVLVVFFGIQAKFMPKQQPQTSQQTQTETTAPSAETSAETNTEATAETQAVSPELASLLQDVQNSSTNQAEQTYTITTNKVRVTFTNRGGDIISYELLEHQDTDTGKGVEMADNVSSTNRAFALSLGGTNALPLQTIFTARQIDDYTIGFFYTVQKQVDGKTQTDFTIVKTYSFKPDDYTFKLDVTIDGGENFTGLNFDGVAYSFRTSPQVGPHYNRKVDRYDVRQFMSYSGEKYKKILLGENQQKTYDKNWTWAGIAGKYFEILVIPATPLNMSTVAEYSSAKENDYANAQARFSRLAIGAGQTTDTYYVYIGPRSEKELAKYNTADKNDWNLSGLKLGESLDTSGFFSWLEVILKFLLEQIYKVVKNWGIAIIILTALLKFAMFPLTRKTALGTAKMQQIQPQTQALQAKYKDNPQKLQQETMKLYKEIGYNPMAGCLPMLFTFIILYAMYRLFNNYFEFRGAMFIPKWIPDLSRGDSVATLKFNLPFNFGNQVRLLPIIYVVSQILFSKFTQNGGTASTNQTQMKMMMYGMPLVFFFIFYNAPAGLLIYWIVSNVIQLGQQLFINHTMKNRQFTLVEAKTKNGKKRK